MKHKGKTHIHTHTHNNGGELASQEGAVKGARAMPPLLLPKVLTGEFSPQQGSSQCFAPAEQGPACQSAIWWFLCNAYGEHLYNLNIQKKSQCINMNPQSKREPSSKMFHVLFGLCY